MSIGSVSITKVDGNQGAFNEPERLFLYLGKLADAGKNGELISIGVSSNLDELLGAGESALKTQIEAARLNSRSENFGAYAIGVPDDGSWSDILFAALDKPLDLNIEAVVLTTPFASSVEIAAAQAVAASIQQRFGKFVFIIGCVAGCAENQSWGEYVTAIAEKVSSSLAADLISVVPLLFGNDLGCYAGRLADGNVSLGDSPMRVATGALIGLSVPESGVPVDSAGTPLSMVTVAQLSQKRFSVAQWYTGYAGIYWADGSMLAPEGSDYQVIEHLRPVHYCSRRVRTLAIGRIADRLLNNTPQSIAANITYFGRVLREASKSITLFGKTLPAMIMPPKDGDVTIEWISRTEVAIGLTVRPYYCPKKIKVYIGLDLN